MCTSFHLDLLVAIKWKSEKYHSNEREKNQQQPGFWLTTSLIWTQYVKNNRKKKERKENRDLWLSIITVTKIAIGAKVSSTWQSNASALFLLSLFLRSLNSVW